MTLLWSSGNLVLLKVMYRPRDCFQVGQEDRLPLKTSGLATTDSVYWAMGMTGLWGVLAPVDEDEDEDEEGLRNGWAKNDLSPALTGALFVKFLLSGLL